MKTKILLFITLITVSSSASSQNRFFTRTGTIRFFSETSMENIEAINHQASAVFDVETGEIAASAQMKGFEFEKALMQEHFNENYVESEKYPAAIFKGKIKNYDKSKFTPNNSYNVEIEGDLTLHGETKHILSTAKIVWGESTIKATSSFYVQVSDFNVKIPKAVIDNISESILVDVDFNMEPYSK